MSCLFVFTLLSCEKEGDDAKTFDFVQFKIEAPENWFSSTNTGGHGTKAGTITDGRIELIYTYYWGDYSWEFNNLPKETYTFTNTTIDGKPAVIVQSKEKGVGVIGVFIEVGEQNKFHMYGQNIKDEATVLKIFNSVKF